MNGGHPPPMLLRAGADEPELLMAGGTLVGILPRARFTESEVTLSNGDVLLVYSDGLSEAMDAEMHMFDDTGVIRALGSARALEAELALRTVVDCVDRFVGGRAER